VSENGYLTVARYARRESNPIKGFLRQPLRRMEKMANCLDNRNPLFVPVAAEA
jgi:hypothetical protein